MFSARCLTITAGRILKSLELAVVNEEARTEWESRIMRKRAPMMK